MKLLIKFKTQKHLNKLKKHNKLIVKVNKRIISTIFNWIKRFQIVSIKISAAKKIQRRLEINGAIKFIIHTDQILGRLFT